MRARACLRVCLLILYAGALLFLSFNALYLIDAHTVRTFKELTLPEPPKKFLKKHAKQEIRETLIGALKDAAQGLVESAVEALPFGSIALSLVKNVVGRISTIKENEEAAAMLKETAESIAKRGDTFIVFFNKNSDDEGSRLSDALLQQTFLSMRLVAEIQEKRAP